MNLTTTTEALAAAMIDIEEGPGKRNSAGLYVPFQDTGGVWTIAKGHTNGVTADTPPADDAQAAAWFAEDQATLFSKVTVLPALEGAAWVDFGYNCGPGAMYACMLAVPSHLQYYIHDSKGNVQPGLVTRRQREYWMILLSRQLG